MSPTLAQVSTLAYAGTSVGEAITFWILAPIALGAAIAMVASRNAVHAALLLIVDLFCLAVFYALQQAPFLAAVQVIVYTGAIMILFLFVLMLVGVDSSDSLVETLRGQRLAAGVAGLGFVALLVGAIGNAVVDMPSVGLARANAAGNVAAIALLLFSKYFFAFEVTSALLIVAAVGAMVLAHRERIGPRPTQRERSRTRFGHGGIKLSSLPPPGVYARHNAVDTAALLPDGSPAPTSVELVVGSRHQPADYLEPAIVAGGAALAEHHGEVGREAGRLGEHDRPADTGAPTEDPERSADTSAGRLRGDSEGGRP